MVEIKENILFSVVPLKEMEPTWYGLKWGTDIWERAYEMFPSATGVGRIGTRSLSYGEHRRYHGRDQRI